MGYIFLLYITVVVAIAATLSIGLYFHTESEINKEQIETIRLMNECLNDKDSDLSKCFDRYHFQDVFRPEER